MTLTPEQREEIARAIAPFLEGGREFDQMPPDRIALRQWSRQRMCGFNDATQSDALEIPAAIEPIINRLIEEARDKALEEVAVVAEGEVVPIYDDTPNEIDATCNSVVRGISTAIRALKTKDAANG